MRSYTSDTNKSESRSVADRTTERLGDGSQPFQFHSNRPEAIAQKNHQEIISNSPQVKQLDAYQKMADAYSLQQNGPVQKKQSDGVSPLHTAKEKEIPQLSLLNTNGAATDRHQLNTLSPVVQRVAVKKKAKKKNQKNKFVKKAIVPLGKKQAMKVRNPTNNYSSGIINNLSVPRGVNPGPRAEAQKVASFLGGSWVGGHMVNDQLGGSGGYDNIVPITSSMNGRHKTIENQANNLLSNGHGNAVEYKMRINSRENRVNGNKTVKNLPVEFQQTLDVYPQVGPMYTITGQVLKHP